MTQLFDQALSALRGLPAPDQEAMAAIILGELEDEEHWKAAFAGSQDQLARLADRVREDIAAGKWRAAGMDEL